VAPASPPEPAGKRVVLADGAAVHVRPIEAGDKELLQAGLAGLGEESRYRRFLHPVKDLTPQELAYFTEIDHENHEALVAVGAHGDEPVGVARYVRLDDPQAAEVAVAVVDGWQGRGVGTLLMHELRDRARSAGVHRFTATCLADNNEVIDLLRRLGRTRVDHPEPGLAEVTIELREPPTPDSALRAALRAAAAQKLRVLA
jgi:RimJ/RimL family protein N-acetyltransferase